MKKKYIRPKLKKEKIKLNFFYSNQRYIDSLDMLQSSQLLTASCGVSVCLLPNTKICMLNKSTKQIKDIVSGDQILTYNLISKKFASGKVSLLSKKVSTNGYLIINDVLEITDNHQLWINNSEWIDAGKVQIGDQLINSSGMNIRVDSIKNVNGEFTVYNMHIDEKEHNFFAEDILVHNQVSSGNSS